LRGALAITTVVARLDPAIQYPEALVIELALIASAAAYWMPRSSRGMTAVRVEVQF
jgi:hypothetical protein